MALIRRSSVASAVLGLVAVVLTIQPGCEESTTIDIDLPEPVYADPPEERPELNDSLFRIILAEDEQRAIELVEQGASVHAQDDRGISALHFAARATMPDLIRLLLMYGADVDVTFGDSIQPIHWAARAGASDRPRAEETIDVLLQYGADINAPTGDGTLPISYAIMAGNEDWQQFMISRGSNPG